MNYKLLFESTELGIVYQNANGDILEANPAAENILGYSEEELKNLSSMSPEWNAIKEDGSIYPGEEHPAMLALNTGKPVKNKIMGILNPETKKRKWIRIDAFPEIKENQKKPHAVFTTFLDVTEIKISEENVRRCEKVLKHSTNAIGMSTPEGKHWYQNKAFDDLFGPVSDDPPSTTFVDESVGREVFNTIMSGSEWFGEVEMYGYDKKVLNILLRAYPIKDNSGKITDLVGEHMDITARKEMEKKIIESEKRYRTIIERGKDAIYLSDMTGKIQQTNEIACQNLGYARDELLSMYVKDIDVNFALDKSFNDFVNSLTPDSQTIIESIHKRKNGSTFPVEINIGKFESPGENYIIGFARDISDRKKSEEQLKLTQFGIDHSQIAVFQIDEDACIKYANEQACNSLGYTQEELLKMKIYQLDPNFDTQKWKKHRAETRELGSRTIETQHRRKDGTFIPVEVTINYIIFENKNISFSFAKDITERKKAEDLLRISETQLLKAAQIAKLGYWEIDWTTNIFTFNDQFYSIYGTTAEKVGGYQMSVDRYAKLFVHPDDIERVFTGNHKTNATNEPYFTHKIEHRVIFANGETGYIAVRYYMIKDKKGRDVKSIGVNQDITAQKLIENELINARIKAEENDQFKTAFLNNMSHEIRTPLNVILGYAGLIEEGGNSVDELKSLTAPIFRSSNQLQKIIEDILDISRIETGQLTVSYGEVNINKLVEEVVGEQKLRAEKKNLSLYISGKLSKNNSVVRTDSSKLKQILVNLVTNAIKYSIKGSVIISLKTRKNDILFNITDTGVGIEKEYHDIIFQRFQRLASLNTNNYHSTTEGGTGLGLPISKGLVELLGGKIWLESIPQNGTTFYFTIPRK